VNFRIEAEEDRFKLRPVGDEDEADLYKLAHHLGSWGFGPDYHGPRPATEAEIASIDDMGSGHMGEWLREKGIIWYEWPLVVQRAKEHATGPGFDDLREQLVRHGNEISFADLSKILQFVRFRNLPPGRSARSYTC
jgi:hypothetical protein